MSKKQKLRDDIELLEIYAEALEIELKLAHDDNEDVNRRLGIANSTVCKQIDEITQLTDIIQSYVKHIEMINRQLEQQDKAIERKDSQWLGLRMAFQDALINNQV